MFLHSVVATNLENLNLLTALKYTDKDGVTRDLTLYSWNGKLVVVDDGMPAEAGYFPADSTTEGALQVKASGATDGQINRRRSPPTLGRAPCGRTAMWCLAPGTPAMCWATARSAMRTWA